MPTGPGPAEVDRVQRRTVRVLVLTQAVGAVGITIGIATASLLARDLSGSEALSGLAQTAQVLGAAVISFLLAPLMARRGRRTGLATGYLTAAAGGLLAVLAGVLGSMPLLLVGAVLLGAGTSANNAARYAATDLATDATRARSLSLVVWATTIGAVAGPNLSGPSGAFADLVGIPELTGPFALGALGLLLAALVVGVLLRPDPLLLAQAAQRAHTETPGAGAAAGASGRRTSSAARARRAIRENPVLGYAIAALALAHATMIGVMVMTPLHMEHGGAGLKLIGVVISVHVLGMFAFSPLVGLLADRIGRAPVLGAGGVALLLALVLCAAAPSGMSWQVTAGLFMLGLGWSLVMVSASTLVAEHAPLAVRTDVQGASDLLMGLAAAATGALAGLVVDVAGYPTLALLSLALVAGVLGAALRAGATQGPQEPTRRTA
ncbi:MFS transporter [Nocardioides sp. zg-536]|uniref:MFS transporter n=1 Tax=Nocardioides faecalis TaxID=2803858 RepID=A0A938Y6E3_9ACTN|nr:MFS transporter [Nocardioides faecalis]MBS4754163.1 MFS transporter [Nocardioides faecalis]QVI60534.1 MFS transporter [Nocardioides faecalis]